MTAASTSSASEEPAWRLAHRDGAFELREYEPVVVAETVASGSRGAAANEGFRRLLRYISGANAPNRKIEMTSPVLQRSREIAMTTPVSQSRRGDRWVVGFVMPRGSQLDQMPRPQDSNIVLRTEAPRRVAVIRFSGFATEHALRRHSGELRAWLAARGETTEGNPVYAFYDPPWTLPWARRNEIMIELNQAEQ